MDDTRILRFNEQLKGVSGVFFNLGAAAIGAAVARAALIGAGDWIGVLWFLGACVLIWLGLKFLRLLEG